MTKKQENKDLAVLNQTDMVLSVKPDYIKEDSARGNESVTIEDITIPQLAIVQALSPCRKKADPAYIPGAEEGMLYNTVTRQLYGPEVLVCFADFKVEYLLFKTRKSGGGFRGAYKTEAEAIAAREMLEDANVIEIIKAHQHYLVLVDPKTGVPENIALSLSSTKLKVSRRINSFVAGADRFSKVFTVSTVEETNEKGSFFNFKVSYAGFPSLEIYKKGEELYEMMHNSAVNAAIHSDEIEEDAVVEEAY